MTYEEARQMAINIGALKPQGWKENYAASVIEYNGGFFSETTAAQSRLEVWTQAILRGEDPRST